MVDLGLSQGGGGDMIVITKKAKAKAVLEALKDPVACARMVMAGWHLGELRRAAKRALKPKRFAGHINNPAKKEKGTKPCT